MRLSLIDLLGDKAPFISIVDIGAMALPGERAAYANLQRPGKHRVVGFEPAQAECDRLNAMKLPGHTYLPYFIGNGEECTFHECNFPMTSSLFPPNTRLLREFQNLAELTVPVRQHRVKTRRLDDIPEIGACDLLKIDVQGAELDVFKNGEKILDGVAVVHTEVEFVPLYTGQALFADVDLFLRSRGLEFHGFISMSGRCFKPLVVNDDINRAVRQTLWADAIYVRDFTRFDELSPDTLLKIAVIAYENYESADLAARALQHYDAKTGSAIWHQFMKALLGAEPPPPPPL